MCREINPGTCFFYERGCLISSKLSFLTVIFVLAFAVIKLYAYVEAHLVLVCDLNGRLVRHELKL